MNQHKGALIDKGFSITTNIFSDGELQQLISLINNSENEYAIRQLITKVPEILELVFQNKQFKQLYNATCGKGYFLSKAIFLNKPSRSNWFVSYHQDLSISVKEKKPTEAYSNWTNKNGQLGVIPPKEILEDIVTIRIHLDKTDETNGALRVIPNSHTQGIIRIDASFNKNDYDKEVLCEVSRGGVLIMKPLLVHASSKSISEFDRRVIHLEFCKKEIPMKWLERKEIV